MKKLRIRNLLCLWALISAVIVTIMLVSNHSIYTAIKNERDITTSGMDSIALATQLQKGSDTLTCSVWRFVATGNVEYSKNYIYELNIAKSRDIALDALRNSKLASNVMAYAETAKLVSDRLLERELYAMRLVYEGQNIASMPSEIAAVELSSDDEALSGEEKVILANNFVFGPDYQEAKQQISSALDMFSSTLQTYVSENISTAMQQMDKAQIIQRVSQIVLLVLWLLLIIVLYQFLVKPILQYSRYIESHINSVDGGELTPIGTYETRQLAHDYNHIVKQLKNSDTILARQNEELLLLSKTDFLTKLYTRSSIEDYINTLLVNFDNASACFSVMMLDLDYFKKFNDTYGHPAGDKVLKIFAGVLRDSVATLDGMVARIGGEEFFIVINGADDNATAQYAANLLAVVKSTPISLDNGQHVHITFSLGSYIYRGGAQTLEQIYANVDKALYCAKKNGRARHIAFDDMPE